MERQENAEIVALQALGWLAADAELLPVFLGASGAARQDLAQGARDPAFLGAVLDFLLLDDTWIIAFCDSVGLPYEALAQARAALPGGAQTHWT